MTRIALLFSLFPAVAFADAQVSAPKTPLELVLQYVVAPLLALVGPLVVAGLAKLVTYLHAKEKESLGMRVGATIADATYSVVAELDVTMRPKLEAALADGVLTDVEKAQLKQAALEAVKTKLPAAVLADARTAFGPLFETWLSGLVERSVTQRNAAEAAASPPGP